MKNTVKMIIYFIVMIGINFGQCCGMDQKVQGGYAYTNQDAGTIEVHCPPGQTMHYAGASIAVVNITQEDFNNLKQQVVILSKENSEMQQLLQQNPQIYCTKLEMEEFILKQNLFAVQKEELDNKKLQELQQNQNSLQAKFDLLQTNYNNLQQTQIAMQTQMQCLGLLQHQLASQGIVTQQQGQSPSFVINNNGSCENKAEIKSTNTNVDYRAGLYSKFPSPKTLFAMICILGGFIKEGPVGAAVMATVVGSVMVGLNKEAWQAFQRKIKIGVCGTGITVIALFVALTSYDSDARVCAACIAPTSLIATAVLLACDV